MRLISLLCMPLPRSEMVQVQAVITVAGPGPSSYTDRSKGSQREATENYGFLFQTYDNRRRNRLHGDKCGNLAC
ncbi:hypothetical protein CI102_8073 [Trichoderma harzianum]|nr:hypothetical protein CI102_8073 [Trichoderma harzianum]